MHTTRHFHPAIAARLPLLEGVGPADEWPPERVAAWNAHHGPVEAWELEINDRLLAGPHGDLPVRVYVPRAPAPSPRPALVWLHGGSFVAGDLEMPETHEVARGVAGRAGAVVVSVDYRLCGDPGDGRVLFPVPVDEAEFVLDWVRGHAPELGADATRVALGGASAGGCLAAAATLRLARAGRAPWRCLLLYPVTHPTSPAPDEELAEALAAMPEALGFPPSVCEQMVVNYTGRGADEATDEAFPGLAGDLGVFPPTLVETCEFDDLRAQGDAFARALAQAGVEVEHRVAAGVLHGHLNAVGLEPAHRTLDRMAAFLR